MVRGAGLLLAVLVLGPAIFACSNDSENGASPTATPADSTVVEQGTVANLGPVRVGVVSVTRGSSPTEGGQATLTIMPQSGAPTSQAVVPVGGTVKVEGGALRLLATAKSDGRDAVRLKFEATK